MSQRRLEMWGLGVYTDPRNAEFNALVDGQIAYAESIVAANASLRASLNGQCYAAAGTAPGHAPAHSIDWDWSL